MGSKDQITFVWIFAALLLFIALYSANNIYQRHIVPSSAPVLTVSDKMSENAGIPINADFKILKKEVNEKVKYYSYKSGDRYMEVLAVKAADGSIRTALNTCKLCYDSGKGFYRQEGKKLVCQNCGSEFDIDYVEIAIGDCNPIAITRKKKVEDNDYIMISNEFLEENKDLFSK